jgi:hypothetical protein
MAFPEPAEMNLTLAQYAALAEHFRYVEEQSSLKAPGMLVAQIHGDSKGTGAWMKVMFIEHERAMILSGVKQPLNDQGDQDGT